MAEEETSMRRSRNLIILAVVFVLLLGSYVYVTKRPLKKTDTAAKDNSIELLKLDAKTVKKITLNSKDGAIVLERKGEDWTMPSRPDIKLDKSTIDSLAATFANLNADTVISETQDNLENYGLKTPAAQATALLDDGTEKTVYVGIATVGNTGYYATLKGDSKIYVIPYADGNHFSYKLSDIRDKNLVSIDPANMTYMKFVLSNGKTVELKKTSKSSPGEQDYAEGIWLLKQGYYKADYTTDSEKTDNLASGVAAITISDVVEDNAADLAKYGLDKPSLQAAIKTDKDDIQFIFGKDNGQGQVYFKFGNSNTVYTADKDKVDALSVSTFDLVDKFAYIINIDNVDSVVIESQGKKNVMSLARSTKKENDKEETVTTYKINDKEMQEDDFKKLYQEVIGLLIDSENDKNVTDNAEVKITFNLNTGSKKQVVTTYSTYNADFYAIFRDGKSDFLISKDKVKQMLTKVDEAAKK